jgi:hypothetical protein
MKEWYYEVRLMRLGLARAEGSPPVDLTSQETLHYVQILGVYPASTKHGLVKMM